MSTARKKSYSVGNKLDDMYDEFGVSDRTAATATPEAEVDAHPADVTVATVPEAQAAAPTPETSPEAVPDAGQVKKNKKTEVLEKVDAEKLYKIPQVAEYLDVSCQTVYNLISRGHLQARKVGREFRVTQSAIDSYVRG